MTDKDMATYKKLSETQVKRTIKDYCAIRHIPNIWLLQGLGSYPGLTDMALFWRGQTIWCEVKIPGKDLTPAQAEFRAVCLASGIPHIVVHSIEELEAFLEQVD